MIKYMDKKHKRFLDDLRASGLVNMFGACPYIEREFKVDRKIAREILSEWMKTFK